MSMTMIIIISLLVLNLSLTLIMFWILHSVLEATKSLQDTEYLLKNVLELNNHLIEKYTDCLNGVYERETTILDACNSWAEEATETYGAITKAYDKMHEQYKSICDIQTKLLECWKGCEERYSQSYELFKHCSDNLKEVSFQLTDLANVSTEDEYFLTLNEACDTVCLDCPYDDLSNRETKCKNCPVHEIMQNNEWTEDDYREAANTHPDDVPDDFKDVREKGGDS